MSAKKALVITNDVLYASNNYKEHHPVFQFLHLLKICNVETSMDSKLHAKTDLSKVNILCIAFNAHTHFNHLIASLPSSTKKLKLILFNVPVDKVCEKQALLAGVDGVFYQNDRSDIMLKGIEALLRNEHWFKRTTMGSVVSELLDYLPSDQDRERLMKVSHQKSTLTRREQSVVKLVATGSQNIEIANSLSISVNTVKTHMYSIFRKTQCRNRVELIKWANAQALSV